MPERTDHLATEYVDDAWKQSATPQEALEGRSKDISTRSYPSAFRLGMNSPYEAASHVADNYTPYRGGATVDHGVTQLFRPTPPDAPLEPIPSPGGPVIGSEAAGPAQQFPDPIAVQVVSMPQPNVIPLSRTVQANLPPRNGKYGIPTVVPLVGREQERTNAWFATDNHEEEDPGAPYCVHITFDRDRALFDYQEAGRSKSMDGIPLMSNGNIYGPVPHTEGVFSFNTEHFDSTELEYYLSRDMYLNKALWLADDMTADEFMSLEMSTSRREKLGRVRSAVSTMDFLAMVENLKHRTIFGNLQYASQVG